MSALPLLPCIHRCPAGYSWVGPLHFKYLHTEWMPQHCGSSGHQTKAKDRLSFSPLRQHDDFHVGCWLMSLQEELLEYTPLFLQDLTGTNQQAYIVILCSVQSPEGQS